MQELLDFCRVHDSVELFVTDTASFKAVVKTVARLDAGLSNARKAWNRQPGYVHHFLRRKLVLHALVSTPVEERKVDWTEVDLGTIKNVCPDRKSAIDYFPGGDNPNDSFSKWFPKYSAADMSQLCFHRVDFPIFVPLYACLFNEVFEKFCPPKTKEELCHLVQSGAFLQAAQRHVERTGFAAHPYNLIAELLSESPEPVSE